MYKRMFHLSCVGKVCSFSLYSNDPQFQPLHTEHIYFTPVARLLPRCPDVLFWPSSVNMHHFSGDVIINQLCNVFVHKARSMISSYRLQPVIIAPPTLFLMLLGIIWSCLSRDRRMQIIYYTHSFVYAHIFFNFFLQLQHFSVVANPANKLQEVNIIYILKHSSVLHRATTKQSE